MWSTDLDTAVSNIGGGLVRGLPLSEDCQLYEARSIPNAASSRARGVLLRLKRKHQRYRIGHGEIEFARESSGTLKKAKADELLPIRYGNRNRVVRLRKRR